MGYLKLFRFMSVMMVQTRCKLNITELFIPQTVSIFNAEKLETSATKETTELEKWQSEISPEY